MNIVIRDVSSIMNFNAKYLKKVTNEDGQTEITFSISGYRDKEIIKQLEKDVLYRIGCSKARSKRTIDQNNFLWSIIHEINVARGTERATDDWNIYIEALERAGAKYEYVAVLPEAEALLSQQFRAIKYMNSFEHNGRTFNSYKVFYGSSKMDTKEMTMLLETVLDMAAEMGIHLQETEF